MLEHLGLSHLQPERHKVPRRHKRFQLWNKLIPKANVCLLKYNTNNVSHKGRHWAKYLLYLTVANISCVKGENRNMESVSNCTLQLPAMKVSGLSKPRDCIWALIFNRLCQLYPPWTCLSLNSFTVLTSTTSCCNGFHNLIMHCVKKYFLCLC